MVLILNMVVSVWLFASAFILPHSTETAWNSMGVSLAVAAFALIAYSAPGRPGLRWLMAIAAIWLLIGTMVLPHLQLATLANDVVVAFALGAISIVAPRKYQKGAAAPSP
jgi:hypothetical protein